MSAEQFMSLWKGDRCSIEGMYSSSCAGTFSVE